MGSIEYMGSQTFYIDDDGLCWESKDKKTQFDIVTRQPITQDVGIIKEIEAVKVEYNTPIIKRKAGRPKKAVEVI